MNTALPGGADLGVLTLGNLTLEPGTDRIELDGQRVELTYHEAELLRVLVENANRILSYDVLCRLIWNISDRQTVRHLNVLVHRLRAKLAASSPYGIETVRGRGYGLLRSRDA